MKGHLIAVTGTLLVCLGCGSSGGSNNNTPRISVTPTTTTVTAGGAAVAFTGTLNNTTGTISWSLSGPGSIAPTSGNTTSYTPPSSVAASTTATITASVGTGLNASATITINPPPAISVSGTVVDMAFRKFPGVSVIIGSQNTVTDSNGQFTIANVTPPYDLTALVTITSGAKSASVYHGLTRSDPTVFVRLSSSVTQNTATLTGVIVGGDPLGTLGEQTAVFWGSQMPSGTGIQGALSNPYTLELSWPHDVPAITGNVHALQWAVDPTFLPTSYKGYAVRTGIAVASGDTISIPPLALAAPDSTTVGGSVTLPSGTRVGGKSATLVFDDTAEITLATETGVETSGTTSFSYPFPNISGATATLVATGTTAGGAQVTARMAGIALGTTNVSFVLPTPTSAILPADGATGIGTATDFSWTAVTGGNVVYLFQVQPLGVATQPSYVVFTTGTTARIPDLTAQGLGLPSGASYLWSALAVGPHSSLDSAAGAGAYIPTGNVMFTDQTNVLTFTTQ